MRGDAGIGGGDEEVEPADPWVDRSPHRSGIAAGNAVLITVVMLSTEIDLATISSVLAATSGVDVTGVDAEPGGVEGGVAVLDADGGSVDVFVHA